MKATTTKFQALTLKSSADDKARMVELLSRQMQFLQSQSLKRDIELHLEEALQAESSAKAFLLKNPPSGRRLSDSDPTTQKKGVRPMYESILGRSGCYDQRVWLWYSNNRKILMDK